MSKKVYELARELDMESKELLEKIKGMGIEAKGHNSVLSDIDAKAVANIIVRNRKKTAETKIVTAAPAKKTKSSSKEKEVKISVKPAAAAVMMGMRKKTERKDRQESGPVSQKTETPSKGTSAARTSAVSPPPGTPLPRAAITPPLGIPLPKSESKQPIREELIKKENYQETAEMPIKDIATETEQVRPIQEKELLIPEKDMTEPVKHDPPKKKTEAKTDKKAVRAKDAKGPAGQKSTKPSEAKVSRPIEHKKEDRPKRDDSKTEAKKETPGRRAKPDDPRAKEGVRKKPDSKGKADKAAPKHEVRKNKDRPGLPSMEKPPVRKPHKQRSQKPKEPDKEIILEELEPGTKIVNVPITVKGLSEQIEKSSSDVIMALMKLGIMANINQNLDEDMVVLLGEELGIPIVVDKIEEEIVEEGLELFEDSEEDLTARSPVITVMGHVDHGKTSLLDAIRKTNVTTTESGGITQHIGASEAVSKGKKIVFLDTPGHEAFTTMRARGAHVTDIAVLVVAADDSVKPQTVESISHAKAAGIPVIVAINKMDKPDADPQRVMQDLTEHDILVEEWGGETICVPVSAKTGEGISNLLEMILLQAEVLELKANPDRLAAGTVIEARLDKAKGPVATLLVLNGTLHSGDPVVAGTCHGRVRAMTNYKGDSIRNAGPATAVEITGLTEVPEAGDEFHAVKEDRIAREIAEQRKLKLREEIMARNASVTLEQLFSQIKEGEVKELNLIIKADVQGSVGALTQSLEKLQTENVKVRIIHTGVGTVTESDIMLAGTSNAIIIGFNVRPSSNISALAEREKVEIRSYRIIYEIIDDIEAALKGLLDPIYKEVILGKAEIRNIFKVPGTGMVGGAYIQEGKVLRNSDIRLLRDGIIVFEGKISSLKRYKDDVREVAQGFECGIGIENFNDIKEGDIVEAYKMEEIMRK